MSYFAEELELILAEEKVKSAHTICEIASIHPSRLCRVRANKQNISFKKIDRLAAALSADENVYLRLLRARLRDECTDPRAERIAIIITESRLKSVMAIWIFGLMLWLGLATAAAQSNVICQTNTAAHLERTNAVTMVGPSNRVFKPYIPPQLDLTAQYRLVIAAREKRLAGVTAKMDEIRKNNDLARKRFGLQQSAYGWSKSGADANLARQATVNCLLRFWDRQRAQLQLEIFELRERYHLPEKRTVKPERKK